MPGSPLSVPVGWTPRSLRVESVASKCPRPETTMYGRPCAPMASGWPCAFAVVTVVPRTVMRPLPV